MIKKTLSYLSAIGVAILFFSGSVSAQEPQAAPQPTKEHQWLKQFVGEWSSHSKAEPGPGQPGFECKGTFTAKMLGEFWVVNEMSADFMGSPMNGVQSIGYDEQKKKYVGTWIDSMSSFIWHYEGSVDKSGKILTLEAEGPNFMTGQGKTKFQDIYEFKSPDEYQIKSTMLGDDGKWITFMTGVAKRTK